MLPPNIGTCVHGHVNILLVPVLCQVRSSCLTFFTELEFNICAANAAISISLLHLHSQLKVLHFCTTKHVLTVYPYPQVCGRSNCGALLQHYCHLHRHSHDSRKENTAANDRREIERCHHAVLVGTTKHTCRHTNAFTGSIKCSHYSVKYHRAAAHSLITNIIFNLLIILKPFTGMMPVSVAAYHSVFLVYPN